MASREVWLISEAETWRREGLIDQQALDALNARYATADEGPSTIQKILYAVGGVVLFLGIFFAFTQFWDDINAATKLSLLLGMAAASYAAAVVLEVLRRWHSMAAIGWGIGGLLTFFGFSYARDAGAPWALVTTVVVLAFLIAILTLALGYIRRPAAAFVGAGLLYMGFPLAIQLTRPDEAATDRFVWTLFVMGLTLTVANLAMWWWAARGARPPWIRPAGVRLAGVAFPVGLVPSYLALMGIVVDPREALPVILGLLAIGGALVAAGILLRSPESVLVGGITAVVGSVWLGFDQGDLLGTSIALVLSAIALIALAQSGLLRRWLTAPPAGPW